MDKNTSQFNLRTIFLVLTIIASLVAMSPWQSNARNTAFRLHGDQTQLEQALINCFELEQGELNFPPELDQAEQLVHLLGGIGGAPMYYEFSESQLLDVDLDGHPECTAWDPDIPFVLDNGKVRWMNRTTGDILEFEEVAKLFPKGPSTLYGLLAFGTFIASCTILLWRSKYLQLFFALLILLLLWGVASSGVA